MKILQQAMENHLENHLKPLGEKSSFGITENKEIDVVWLD